MRLFELIRDDDVSGISGTGLVAQGVEFDDGTIAMRWLTTDRSTCIYDASDVMERIHGHGGSTHVEWMD